MALDHAVEQRAGGNVWHGRALAALAMNAVLRVQVLQAPHIAEGDLAAMTRMEQEMAASERAPARPSARWQASCPRRHPLSSPRRPLRLIDLPASTRS